jgi:hypothetical protein
VRPARPGKVSRQLSSADRGAQQSFLKEKVPDFSPKYSEKKSSYLEENLVSSFLHGKYLLCAISLLQGKE